MCEYCRRFPHDPRCPYAQIEFIGSCAACGEVITTAYEYYVDNDGHLFCSKECAVLFHGIHEAT